MLVHTPKKGSHAKRSPHASDNHVRAPDNQLERHPAAGGNLLRDGNHERIGIDGRVVGVQRAVHHGPRVNSRHRSSTERDLQLSRQTRQRAVAPIRRVTKRPTVSPGSAFPSTLPPGRSLNVKVIIHGHVHNFDRRRRGPGRRRGHDRRSPGCRGDEQHPPRCLHVAFHLLCLPNVRMTGTHHVRSVHRCLRWFAGPFCLC